ncbi:hypothetical protein [Escherichia coli]|uniref:VirB4 family type IV secretion/conjugal transfer ATPase n=1 Tax=Escherichia coli TaxID=562 RepID=UPI000D98460A|nr:type IV secretion/conjugal transfer ATPase, VirB4 family [Escherichia coli]
MLKEADFEYLLTQSFSCLSESSAKTFLTHQEKSCRKRATVRKASWHSLYRARYADVQRVRDGYHHGTVHVWDNDQNAVQRKARRVRLC